MYMFIDKTLGVNDKTSGVNDKTSGVNETFKTHYFHIYFELPNLS